MADRERFLGSITSGKLERVTSIGRANGTTKLRCEVPAELVAILAGEYGQDDLQRLADTAVRAAMEGIDSQDLRIEEVAKNAVAMALGLKALPEGDD